MSLLPAECAEEIAYGGDARQGIPKDIMACVCTDASIAGFVVRELRIVDFDASWGSLDKFCTPCLERVRLTGHLMYNLAAIKALSVVPSVTFLEIQSSSSLSSFLKCADKVFPSLRTLLVGRRECSLGGVPLLALNEYPNLAVSLRSLFIHCEDFFRDRRYQLHCDRPLLRLESLTFVAPNDHTAEHLNTMLSICDLDAIRDFTCYSNMSMRNSGVAHRLVNCSHFAVYVEAANVPDSLSLPWILSQFLYQRRTDAAEITTLTLQRCDFADIGNSIDLFLAKFGATIRSSSLFLPENPVQTLRLMPKNTKTRLDLHRASDPPCFNLFADALSRPECETQDITITMHLPSFFAEQPLRPPHSHALRSLGIDMTQLPFTEQGCAMLDAEFLSRCFAGCPRLDTVKISFRPLFVGCVKNKLDTLQASKHGFAVDVSVTSVVFSRK